MRKEVRRPISRAMARMAGHDEELLEEAVSLQLTLMTIPHTEPLIPSNMLL